MTEAEFVLTLDPSPMSRFTEARRPCPASALVIVSSEDQAFRQCVRAGDRHWGPGGDVSEPIRFWRPVTFGEARRLFDGRTVTGLAYRDGFVVMEPQWASALPVRCVDAQSQPEPIVSKTGGGFPLHPDTVVIDGGKAPDVVGAAKPDQVSLAEVTRDIRDRVFSARAMHMTGTSVPLPLLDQVIHCLDRALAAKLNVNLPMDYLAALDRAGELKPDPVEALGLTNPGDVFERPHQALERLFCDVAEELGASYRLITKVSEEPLFWSTLATRFLDHVGHGAAPAPTDLPMDGNAPSYREIAVQALRALEENKGCSPAVIEHRGDHVRLSALLEGADAAVAQGVTDQVFATDAPPEEAKPELATDNGSRITTDADGRVTGVHLSGLVFTNAVEPRTTRYVRPFPPAPSTLHRPGTDAYDNAMERLVLELVRRVQTMEQR